jgi:hypothetical protein
MYPVRPPDVIGAIPYADHHRAKGSGVNGGTARGSRTRETRSVHHAPRVRTFVDQPLISVDRPAACPAVSCPAAFFDCRRGEPNQALDCHLAGTAGRPDFRK